MSICFKLLVLGSHQIVSGIASENGSQEYAKRMHVLKISDLERLQKSVPPAFSIGPQLIDSICRNFLNVLYCPFSEVTPMSQTLHVSPTKTIGADGRQSIRALCYTPGKDSRSCRARHKCESLPKMWSTLCKTSHSRLVFRPTGSPESYRLPSGKSRQEWRIFKRSSQNFEARSKRCSRRNLVNKRPILVSGSHLAIAIVQQDDAAQLAIAAS